MELSFFNGQSLVEISEQRYLDNINSNSIYPVLIKRKFLFVDDIKSVSSLNAYNNLHCQNE